jgi:hypothetical protein
LTNSHLQKLRSNRSGYIAHPRWDEFPTILLSTGQAIYACFLEVGRGFFEGVCGRGHQPLTFRDPPLPLGDSRIARDSIVMSEAL